MAVHIYKDGTKASSINRDRKELQRAGYKVLVQKNAEGKFVMYSYRK